MDKVKAAAGALHKLLSPLASCKRQRRMEPVILTSSCSSQHCHIQKAYLEQRFLGCRSSLHLSFKDIVAPFVEETYLTRTNTNTNTGLTKLELTPSRNPEEQASDGLDRVSLGPVSLLKSILHALQQRRCHNNNISFVSEQVSTNSAFESFPTGLDQLFVLENMCTLCVLKFLVTLALASCLERMDETSSRQVTARARIEIWGHFLQRRDGRKYGNGGILGIKKAIVDVLRVDASLHRQGLCRLKCGSEFIRGTYINNRISLATFRNASR